MANRQAMWAQGVRRKIIKELGGVCVKCGSRERLEVNHKWGKSYQLRKLSQWQRVIIYKREMKWGLLDVLCHSCNLSFWPNGRKT